MDFPQNGNQRTMKSQTGNTYLKYDILKIHRMTDGAVVTNVGQV